METIDLFVSVWLIFTGLVLAVAGSCPCGSRVLPLRFRVDCFIECNPLAQSSKPVGEAFSTRFSFPVMPLPAAANLQIDAGIQMHLASVPG
jgi:hypothetical protein